MARIAVIDDRVTNRNILTRLAASVEEGLDGQRLRGAGGRLERFRRRRRARSDHHRLQHAGHGRRQLRAGAAQPAIPGRRAGHRGHRLSGPGVLLSRAGGRCDRLSAEPGRPSRVPRPRPQPADAAPPAAAAGRARGRSRARAAHAPRRRRAGGRCSGSSTPCPRPCRWSTPTAASLVVNAAYERAARHRPRPPRSAGRCSRAMARTTRCRAACSTRRCWRPGVAMAAPYYDTLTNAARHALGPDRQGAAGRRHRAGRPRC